MDLDPLTTRVVSPVVTSLPLVHWSTSTPLLKSSTVPYLSCAVGEASEACGGDADPAPNLPTDGGVASSQGQKVPPNLVAASVYV